MADVRSQLVDALIQSLEGIGVDEESKVTADALIGALGKMAGLESKESIASMTGSVRQAIEATKSGDRVALEKAKIEGKLAGERLKGELGLAKQAAITSGVSARIGETAEESRKTKEFTAKLESAKPLYDLRTKRAIDRAERSHVVNLVNRAMLESPGSVELRSTISQLEGVNAKEAEKVRELVGRRIVGETPGVESVHPELRKSLVSSASQALGPLTPEDLASAQANTSKIYELTPQAKRLKIPDKALIQAVQMGEEGSLLASAEKAVTGGKFKKLGLAAGALVALPLLAKAIFGSGKNGQEVNPMQQLQLAQAAQQMQDASGQADGRALMNLKRSLDIAKLIQGLQGGQQAAAPVSLL